MASVWVARMRGKHGFERLVAVKTILPKFASDEMFQTMFLDEARIASAIEHTNVAQTLDLGEQHDVLFLVMEWVDGDALTKLLSAVSKRQKKTPLGIILRVLADTCGGLHAAHELRGKDGALLGVVHRDVSPQNILVSGRGVAKLIDFGIAKARDRTSGDTSAGLVKGKVKYMAPEQALGKHLDRRVDVWAVGAILYRVVAGRPPFPGSNELEMLHSLTSGAPPAPLPASVHPAVASIVMRALRHDPNERFASAAEMQVAMEDAMVAAGVATTTLDVAAFAAEHLNERASARKQTLELALGAARERERMAQLLKPTEADAISASGIVDLGSMRPRPPSERPPPPEPEGDLTVPYMARMVAPPAITPAAAADIDARELPTVVVAPTRSRRQRNLTFVVGGGVTALAVVMLVAIAIARSDDEALHVAKPTLLVWSRSLRRPDTASIAASGTSTSEPTPWVSAQASSTSSPTAVVAPRPTPTMTTAPPRPTSTGPSPSPTTPPAPTTPPKKQRIDDGF